MPLAKMGFHVRRLVAGSARMFKLRLYSRSKGTNDADDLRAVPAAGKPDDDDFDDEEYEDYDESSDLLSDDCSRPNCAFNYTPIPLSLHSDVPLSTTCPLDLSLHLGTTPLLTHHPNDTTTAQDIQFCLNRPHSEHAQVWISSCVGLVLGGYMVVIAMWALFHRQRAKVTGAKSSFELVLEVVALEIKVPAFVLGPKVGKLVYHSEAPILSADEVLKRTSEEYGSIVDDEEIPSSGPGNLQAVVRQDVNMLLPSRGPLSGGTPLGLNRVLRVSSAPSTVLHDPTPPNTPSPTTTRAHLGGVYATSRPIPVWAPGVNQRSHRPPPVLIGNIVPIVYNDPRWASMPHTAHPCFSSSPLRQSALPSGYAPLGSS
ncbi:hypothetical protein FRC10_003717 [Ceratobasidium sp. 414]|nr:hypothetical protein FRC10_003717 [Ceratobasidium sp. 414]